jgi:oxaloacetate decarboxylase (Na+ extruding) subunit alpha
MSKDHRIMKSASPDTEIGFVDTTLRDGQESLWATGMRTAMFLPVAARMDAAGFEAIEIIATTNFKKQIRDLKEDPWERIRLAAREIRKTPLRAVRNRYMAAFQITPRSISDLWLERLAANGVREIRLSDPSNTATYWKEISAAAGKAGLRTVINLIFSVSPRHTADYFAKKAHEAAQLAPYRICFKDPGGLLTPEQTRKLVPAILNQSEAIPVELHTHCNTGLGPLCCLDAVKFGVRSLNTALPPLANASSNPSLFNVTKNLRALNYKPRIDEERLTSVSEHFRRIAASAALPVGAPLPYDAFHATHQVPGGMISNLRYQLRNAGIEHRLGEVLEEIARVRADFGYPIMVTPYSQFVGVQATMNVMVGERYQQVSDEVIQYALGFWGDDEAAALEPNVRDKILARPRAGELRSWTPAQPSLNQLKDRLGGRNISDDELLLRYFSSEQDVQALKASPSPRTHLSAGNSLVQLIERLTKRDARRQVYIRTREISLRLEQRAPTSGKPRSQDESAVKKTQS